MSNKSPSAITPALMAELHRKFVKLDWDGTHGAPHWARVRLNGLELARHTGASTKVVELFAFVHDSCRQDEWVDHGHGHRSALYVEELRASATILISNEEAEMLAIACRDHSDGKTKGDVTIQTCWDADRLDLGRVGIRPDPARMCTAAARDSRLIAGAYERSLPKGGWLTP